TQRAQQRGGEATAVTLADRLRRVGAASYLVEHLVLSQVREQAEIGCSSAHGKTSWVVYESRAVLTTDEFGLGRARGADRGADAGPQRSAMRNRAATADTIMNSSIFCTSRAEPVTVYDHLKGYTRNAPGEKSIVKGC